MNTPSNTPVAVKPGLVVQYQSGKYADVVTDVSIVKCRDQEDQQRSIQRLQGLKHCVSIDTCDVRIYPGSTGCKAYDHHDQGPITGNLWSNTIVGGHVRARIRSECNGHYEVMGKLQEFDLGAFKGIEGSGPLIQWIRTNHLFMDQDCIAYLIFHWRRKDGQNQRVVHGALITDRKLNRVKTFHAFELGVIGSPKSQAIMDAVTPHLTIERAINIRPVYRSNAIDWSPKALKSGPPDSIPVRSFH